MSSNTVPLHNPKSNSLNNGRRYLILHNPNSGTDGQDGLQELLQRKLHNHAVEMLPVGDGIEERLAAALQHFRPHRVIAAGGDGTVNLAAKCLLGTETELAILPTGSANGMARELTLPLDLEEALNIAVHGKAMPMDVLCINGKHFCLHLSDVGLNAQVVKRFEDSNRRGMWGYVVQFIKELWSSSTSRFVFILPSGEQFATKAHMVVAANASSYGTGAVINPDARLDDGLFELCIFKRMPFRGMLRLAYDVWFGNVKLHPWTEVKCFEEVTILNPSRKMVQTDGEILGRLPEVHVKALKQVLRVVVPNGFGQQEA